MTYVTEQTPAELRAHMRRLKAMPGWHEPLADRLFREVLDLDARVRELESAAQPVAADGWQPIESAPTAGREMFVVRAFNVRNGFTGPNPYTSDPWCAWREKDGGFARWPHNFPPTHFMRLPPTPA